jgi:hypothetical protein
MALVSTTHRDLDYKLVIGVFVLETDGGLTFREYVEVRSAEWGDLPTDIAGQTN